MAKASTSLPSEADFRAENDVRTLIDAEKIKQDKPRLTRAMKKATEQRAALDAVAAEAKA